VVFGSVVALAAVVVACAPTRPAPAPPTPAVSGPIVREEASGRLASDRVAMVALEGRAVAAPVSATGRWRIDEQGGRQALVRGEGGEPWRVEQRGRLLRVAGDGDDATPWREGPFVARPAGGAVFLRYGARRYRGELWFTPTDSGVMVVNRLPVEDYLRGVVPLEIGTRRAGDQAAIEAQAIAARSYTYVRVPGGLVDEPVTGWNLVATVQHQVYGGVDAEHPEVNAAIDATAGLVLRYNAITGTPSSTRRSWRGSCGGPCRRPGRRIRSRPRCSVSRWVSVARPGGRPHWSCAPRAVMCASRRGTFETSSAMRVARSSPARIFPWIANRVGADA